MASNVKIVPLDPEYIKFLLNPELGFSSYYVVGNAELAPVEKIGVVREMLAAHSIVFRSQLMSQYWESKEPEKITDILPVTFKNLLRFIYGWDTTSSMSFEDTDDLLYAADKYIMQSLKDKLATRLMSLLNYTNICSLLTNPACASVLQLNSEITKILQTETDKVLSSPQFLSCCPEAFVKILEQKILNVPELEMWKAAIKWAKKKAGSEDGKSLRQQLEKPLQHIRVCSMSTDDFCKEVVPTGVLTNEETGAVCTAIATKKVPETLTRVCKNMQVRRPTTQGNRDRGVVDCVKSEELRVVLGGNGLIGSTRELSFSLQTHTLPVELTYLVCVIAREGQFTVTARIQSPQSTVTTVTYTGNCTAAGYWSWIPVSTEQRPVVLSADTSYNITLSDTQFYVHRQTSAVRTEEHFTLEFPTHGGGYGSPVFRICYKTLTLR